MRRRHLARAHLVEVDVDSQVSRLPGRLTAREAAADDGDASDSTGDASFY